MWSRANYTVTISVAMLLTLFGRTAYSSYEVVPEVEIKRDVLLSSLSAYSGMLNTNFPLDMSRSLIETPSAGTSNNCDDDFNLYLTFVNLLMNAPQSEVPAWVLELLDATGKPPTGILEGNVQWVGSFTECLKVQAFEHNSTVVKFRGQYCTAVLASSSPPSIGVNDAIGSGFLPPSTNVSLGLCWPSSCTAPEMAQQLNFLLLLIFNITSVTASIDEKSCYVQEAITYSFGSVCVIFLLVDFALLMLLGTVYEVSTIWRRRDAIFVDNTLQFSKTTESVIERILLSFSIYKNGKKILNTSAGEGSLGCLHGMRFLSIVWIILGHFYELGALIPIKNALDLVRKITFDTVVNGTLSTDTFFVISGFLVAYLFLKEMKKTGGNFGPHKIFSFYFHRYWRLTPALAMAIAIVATLYDKIETGPQWHMFYDQFGASCQIYWWRNLLYIQNLYDTDNQCYPVSWYLACDMQLYLVSLLIIYPLYKSEKVGLCIMSAFLVASMIATALIIHFEKLYGLEFANLPAYMDNGEEAEKSNKLQADVYAKPYCRMSVYCIGIALAVLLHRTKLTVQLHPMVVAGGWLISTVLGLTLVYGTHDYFTGDSTMSAGFSPVFGAFSRPAFALVVAWVIFACVTGHGGWVNSMLSWKAFIPLSRLTYCCYLVHFYVLVSFFGSQENAYYYNQALTTTLFLGLLTLTIVVAFVFSLAFEAPMMELEKIFLPSRRRDDDVPSSLLHPKLWKNPNDVVTTIQSSSSTTIQSSSSTTTRNRTQWRPTNADRNNASFTAQDDVDTRTFYNEHGRPVTTL